MSSSAAKQALSETMSKAEVCAHVGKSKRTVDSYIAHGRLRMGYFNGPNGKTGIFQRADVDALKKDLESPTYRAVVPMVRALPAESNGTDNPVSMAVGPLVRPDALQHFLASVMHAYPVNRPKPWLTLAEAVEFSGLPASYLLAQAKAGKARVINVGTGAREFWRFHRASLAK